MEIKFRVWCKDFGEWEKDCCFLDTNGRLLHLVDVNRFIPVKPENHIMSFYTGLKDKNGVEIFGGDRVAAHIYGDEDPHNLEVYFKDGAFIINYEDSETDITAIGWFPGSLEVIGNIYENPELLEGGQ